MFKLSVDYYERNCLFKRQQVPTQTQMINKMSPPLAQVYFKSMNSKLRVLAGLEPPLKGGGADWYVPPEELLKGRMVMKPIAKEHLSKLSSGGLGSFGEILVERHHKKQEEEKIRVLHESDINWKRTIECSCRQHWDDISREAAERNTVAINEAFHQFSAMYATSINKIEQMLFDAGYKEVQNVRTSTIAKMKHIYKCSVKQQAIALYDKYETKLKRDKSRLKSGFINSIKKSRTATGNQIHDINVEKHTVVEKLRRFLECQNLACQVYVALKEREECKKEIELMQHVHQKKIRKLKTEIALKDFEIRLAKEKERKRHEFNQVWQRKVCAVVKKLQIFVSYCLKMLPEQADFFIDMEKLMMLQLNDALETPEAENIFEPAEPEFHTPVPRPHPFYLVCNKGFKPQLDQNLCPKHCTSSATQMPVIVVNNRCIYAACDNFDKFTDKITEFIHGRRGDDVDFQDDHSYTYDVPVTYTTDIQKKELEQQSSMFRLLQKDLPNIKDVDTECCLCGIAHCFCSPVDIHAKPNFSKEPPAAYLPSGRINIGNRIKSRDVELMHEREPKWESYMDYVKPKCMCPKKAKHHLEEHLPAYMRNRSQFEAAELPNYEPCSLATLKRLVREAQQVPASPPPLVEPPPRTRDVATQYTDAQFDNLCECFSDEEMGRVLDAILKGSYTPQGTSQRFHVRGEGESHTFLKQDPKSFATEAVYTLKGLLDTSDELKEIFKKKDCIYDNK